MYEILGFDHAAHDVEGGTDGLVDLNHNKTIRGILLLPPDQMGP